MKNLIISVLMTLLVISGNLLSAIEIENMPQLVYPKNTDRKIVFA